MQNLDSSRNCMIFLKRNKNFNFFDFFSKGGTLWCQNGKFLFFNFSKFHNFFFQKQVYWDQTGTKINKVKDFGDSSHKTVEMPACFRLFGPKTAPLSRNRVKIPENHAQVLLYITDYVQEQFHVNIICLHLARLLQKCLYCLYDTIF